MKASSQLKFNTRVKQTKTPLKNIGLNKGKKRNYSTDFKTLQKENDFKVNFFGNTHNISLLGKEIQNIILEKDFISSPKSFSNLNIDWLENNHSFIDESEIRNISTVKKRSKKLISFKPRDDPIKKIETKYKKKKQKDSIITTTSELINTLPIKRKSNNFSILVKSMAPDSKYTFSDERENIEKQQFGLSPQNNKYSNIKVVVRFRPLNEIEEEMVNHNIGYKTVEIKNCSTVILKSNSNHENTFVFDRVYDFKSNQEEIFNSIGKEMVKDVLAGYNGTILTYGQSSSGKTFTMYGNDIFDDEKKGIIPNTIDYIFNHIDQSDENVVFQLKFSFLEIYKEVIFDLLTGEKDLKIKENPEKGIHVEGLTEVYIDNKEEFLEIINYSHQQRRVAATKLNSISSRSHSIFMLEITQNFLKNYSKKGTLYLVDLAGSEKVSKTGAVGETLEEAKKINLSLSALGKVINSLTTNSDHIPFRDSKLTRILQESLGGNYKTTLIVNCSPHSSNYEETYSSLKFAQRMKTIKNNAVVNIKLSYEELLKINNKLKKEIDDANIEIIQLKELLSKGNEFRKLNNSSSLMKTDKTYKTEAIIDKFEIKSNLSVENENKFNELPLLVKSNDNKFSNWVPFSKDNNEIIGKIRHFISMNDNKNEFFKKENLEENYTIDEIFNAFNTYSKVTENKDYLIKKLENQITTLENDLKLKEEKIKELEDTFKSYHLKYLDLTEEFNKYKFYHADSSSLKDLYLNILNTRISSNINKDVKIDIQFFEEQKNIWNSFNETLENILKSLVSQSSCYKDDSFKISEIHGINDFKKINYISNISKINLKNLFNNLNKEKEFDKIKKYFENLHRFLEESSNSFSKQKYNNLLLYLLISESKHAFSYKLLENYNENLIGKYTISQEENMTLMSIVFNLIEITQNLLQKNIELNKNSNENFILTHPSQRLTLNRNITSKFSHSRCSGKIEKFITKNTQKLYKFITPKNDIDKHFNFKPLKSEHETIFLELKTEQESIDMSDKYKPFFDKLFENLENFNSLKEYVILSHELSNQNKQFMKELINNFNEIVDKKFEEKINNFKLDSPKLTSVKTEVTRESKSIDLEKIFKSNKNAEKPTKIKTSEQGKGGKKDSLNKSINKSSVYQNSQHNQTLTQDIINTSQQINNSLSEKQKCVKKSNNRNPTILNQNIKSSIENSIRNMKINSFSKTNISKLAKLNFSSKDNVANKKKGVNHRVHKSSLDYSEIFGKNDGNLSTYDNLPLNKKQSRSFILEDNFCSNMVLPSEDPLKNIHNYISEYANIGGATKKFDGITVKKKDNKVTLFFEGGLNAKNKINSPCHQKVKENINGDNSLPIDDSFVSYKDSLV